MAHSPTVMVLTFYTRGGWTERKYKVDADGRDVVLVEDVVLGLGRGTYRKAQEQTRLAHRRVAYQHQLEQVGAKKMD